MHCHGNGTADVLSNLVLHVLEHHWKPLRQPAKDKEAHASRMAGAQPRPRPDDAAGSDEPP